MSDNQASVSFLGEATGRSKRLTLYTHLPLAAAVIKCYVVVEWVS